MRKPKAQPWQAHDPGIWFAHNADVAEEAAQVHGRDFDQAIWLVDSRRGGYVREYDPAGQLVRQHPAAPVP